MLTDDARMKMIFKEQNGDIIIRAVEETVSLKKVQ
jgi:hypothetical protein